MKRILRKKSLVSMTHCRYDISDLFSNHHLVKSSPSLVEQHNKELRESLTVKWSNK